MPDNIILVIGFPRSGTTILSRAIGNHSQVDMLMEPYHQRRDQNFSSDDIRLVASEYQVAVSRNRSILLKETFGRIANVRYSFALLDRAARSGVNCCVVVCLRSPIEAFLSQVEAAAKWERKPKMPMTPHIVDVDWRKMCAGFDIVFSNVFRYTHRVIQYDCFVENAEIETRRIMAAIGYRFEPKQLNFSPENTKNIGGDARAYKAGETIRADSKTDRSKETLEFIEAFNKTPSHKQRIDFHMHLLELKMQKGMSDTQLLMSLFLRHGQTFGETAPNGEKKKD